MLRLITHKTVTLPMAVLAKSGPEILQHIAPEIEEEIRFYQKERQEGIGCRAGRLLLQSRKASTAELRGFGCRTGRHRLQN